MKPCGCEFCNDLRNIMPAKYVGLNTHDGDSDYINIIKKEQKKKSFFLLENNCLYVVTKCPVCGYKFTEEDYDSYD